MARVVAALIVSMLAGCSLAGRTVGTFVDDKTLTAAVKLHIAGEHPSAIKRVNVDVFEGTVYLSGFVERAIEKSDAEIAARRTEGVKQVVNDLVVRGEGESAAAAPAPPRPRAPVRAAIPGVARVAAAWPGGPDHAFDKDGRVVATIYTLAAQDLAEADLRNLPTDGRLIDHVSVYALVNRGVVPGPRYGVVLWHVNEAAAAALLR
jgi:hyperosmotically inducible periplasmic protein